MSYRVIACHHCKKEFTATHGNREYCPETDCQGAKKAVDQKKKYYEVVKDDLPDMLAITDYLKRPLEKMTQKQLKCPNSKLVALIRMLFMVYLRTIVAKSGAR